MKLNVLPHLTWRQTGANEVYIDDINIYKKDFTQAENVEIPQDFINNFNNLEFGISHDILKLNQEYRNYQGFIDIKEELEINKSFLLNNKDNILNDFHGINVKENIKGTLIFDYKSEDIEVFRNSVFNIKLEKNSNLQIVLIQRLSKKAKSFISIVSDLAEKSRIQLVQIDLGASKSYINYKSYINGEEAESDVKTAYFVDDNRYLDINYVLTHLAKKTKSNMLANGVLKDFAEKRFAGTLDFKKGCTLSEGSEEEFVTLLDSTVKNRAIPILLAREDDIVGIHAASAGKIDKDMLFYITSRGFDENEAKRIIIESKIKPILDYIKDKDLREELIEEIKKSI